ncbi:MAG: cytochrome C [Desulfobacterales bacterium S3730MH5]|nr:MAG: cytochrome C [Desulfobacterales bacterium S3730MH5]
MDFHVDMFKMRTILAVISAVLIIINASAGEAGSDTGTEPVGFVGSEACRDCHQKEYKSFITYAKKSSSFESIQRVKKGLTEEEIKKCYFCHTTGYGKPNGFISLEETPHLKNAGCEVCHGPGALHVKTEMPEDIKMKLTMKDCEVCHISERVKAFRYKPMIHGGAH